VPSGRRTWSGPHSLPQNIPGGKRPPEDDSTRRHNALVNYPERALLWVPERPASGSERCSVPRAPAAPARGFNGLLTAGGGHGQVRCKNSGKEFVIKVVDVSKCSAREREAARKECGILQALRHPNIIEHRESFEAPPLLPSPSPPSSPPPPPPPSCSPA